MLNPRHTKLALLALVVWLVAGWTGVHGHFCFDGLEPPVSTHIGLSGEHLDHHPEEQHLDMDVEISQLALTKLVKIDLPLLVVAVLLLLFSINPTRHFSVYSARYFPRVASLLPPPRAPPIFPA